jgi:putative hydrolase of the HAD superfamily
LVIFDLDNTLVDRDRSFRRWAVELVRRHALDPAEQEWLVAADGDGFHAREKFLTAVRDRYGLDEPLSSMLNRYRERIVALLEPDPQVRATIDRLRASGRQVAITTNGETSQQRTKIRLAGLAASVDAVVISDEVGVAKPDRMIFDVTAQRCGLRLADGGWMVGDCPIRDIGGGHAAGLRTIWMRRSRTWDPSLPPPDGIVNSVPEVLPVLTAEDE